jgi:hypothetical protein
MKLGILLTIFRALFSIAVIGLFRPLSSLEIDLPNNLGSPRSVCVRHSAIMTAQLGSFEKHFPQETTRGFSGAFYICYTVGFTLVPNLREPGSREPFTEICRYLFLMSKHIPLGAALLKGIQALALQLKMELPEETLPYFKVARLTVQTLEDVPITYAIPQQSEMMDLLSDDGTDTTHVGVELGKIIAKWSAMSL